MTEANEPTSAEIAAYVERMVAELAALARSGRLDMLAYLLDVAREEATARVATSRMTDKRASARR